MLVYAISSVLCGEKTQTRYASKGIGGNVWATKVLDGNSPLVMQGLTLTSSFRCEDCHIYPKRKLGSSDNTKPDRDANVSHRHRVYPVTIISGINSRPLHNQGVHKPGGQRDLREEGADHERQDEEERHPVAPVFM